MVINKAVFQLTYAYSEWKEECAHESPDRSDEIVRRSTRDCDVRSEPTRQREISRNSEKQKNGPCYFTFFYYKWFI